MRVRLEVLVDAYESRGYEWGVEVGDFSVFNAVSLQNGEEYVVSARLVMSNPNV